MKIYRYKVARVLVQTSEVLVYEQSLYPGESAGQKAIAIAKEVGDWDTEMDDYEAELLGESVNGRN